MTNSPSNAPPPAGLARGHYPDRSLWPSPEAGAPHYPVLQFVFVDSALTMSDEVDQQIECFWFYRDELSRAADFAPHRVNAAVGEAVIAYFVTLDLLIQ